MDHLAKFSKGVALRNIRCAETSLDICKGNLIAEIMILILFTITNIWPAFHCPSWIVFLVVAFNGAMIAGNCLNWILLRREINLWKNLL